MRLFQLGDRVINVDAIAHVHYVENDDRHYCHIFFNSNAAPLMLKGDLAVHFWAVTRHLAIDITAKRQPTEIAHSKAQ